MWERLINTCRKRGYSTLEHFLKACCVKTQTVYDNVKSPLPEGKYMTTWKTGGSKLQEERV